MADALASIAPNCSCFRLCSEEAARSFHLRLPLVTSRSSPWYPYLAWVYRGYVRLPVHLSRFDFFYLMLLPVEWRCNRNRTTSCSRGLCSAWLHPLEPSAAQLEEHKRQWSVRAYQWHRSRLPRLLLNHTLRFLPTEPPEAFYRANALVEVVRRSFSSVRNRECAAQHGAAATDWVGDPVLGAAEGMQYGCWFTPAVGTGIFLPLGRALFVRDRPTFERIMPDALRFPRAGRNSPFRASDCLYANLTLSSGHDTLFMPFGAWGSAEVVATVSSRPTIACVPEAVHVPSSPARPRHWQAAGCMTQTAPLPSGCVPPDVGLRSGWQGGGAQCVCTAAPEALGLDQILNCAGTGTSSFLPT